MSTDGKPVNPWIGDLSVQSPADVNAILAANQNVARDMAQLERELKEALQAHKHWIGLGVWLRHGGFADLHLKDLCAAQVADLISAETGTMLPKRSAEILPQLDQPETVIGLRILTVGPNRVLPEHLSAVAAFATYWNLGIGTHVELGSLVVAPDLRGYGVGTAVVQELFRLNGHAIALATTKTEPARKALGMGGMELASFATDIPLIVRQATCCCEGMGREKCPLADRECRLMLFRSHTHTE